jgi:hypothetical protein
MDLKVRYRYDNNQQLDPILNQLYSVLYFHLLPGLSALTAESIFFSSVSRPISSYSTWSPCSIWWRLLSMKMLTTFLLKLRLSQLQMLYLALSSYLVFLFCYWSRLVHPVPFTIATFASNEGMFKLYFTFYPTDYAAALSDVRKSTSPYCTLLFRSAILVSISASITSIERNTA